MSLTSGTPAGLLGMRVEPVALLAWALLLIPLWWFLGIEQFVWFPVLLLMTFLSVLQRRATTVLETPTLVYWLFVAAVCFSAISIEGSFRWLSFSRNLAGFAVIGLTLLTVGNSGNSVRWATRLAGALVVAAFVCAVTAIAAFTGILRFDLTAPVAVLLPGQIKATGLGELLVQRSLARPAWTNMTGEYWRPTSFFLYPTHLASCMAYCLPIAGYFWSTVSSLRWRALGAIAGLAMAMALLMTFSRAASVAAIVGLAYLLWSVARWRALWRWSILVVGITLALGLALAPSGLDRPEWMNQGEQITKDLSELRGGTSAESRLATYWVSLKGVAERPLTGWGTERDLPDVDLPAGSHSMYMAVLYRHGLIGFALFAVFWLLVWMRLRPLDIAATGPKAQAELLAKYCRCSILVILTDGLATVPITDATATVFLATVVSVGMKVGSVLRSDQQTTG